MSLKFKVWCDSGANIHSKRSQVVTLDDLGIEEEEWLEMDEASREEIMREVAQDRLDWGFEQID
ncbi:hypothetical protein A7J71_17935 [Achromobacter insolitus]|uniref:DUF7167 family protein n=1 Tax=Achromobacter insolitus TaxID=217204 RepID=UPI0007C6F892|nr:hypothetical protein [Achromobacter insolitus]OAE52851.1 hypothetical protein A7J71_17935 [Achromobacter insolitus]OCZ50664.1 hypothetical protein A7P22_15405 [Achromobacter insolitus]